MAKICGPIERVNIPHSAVHAALRRVSYQLSGGLRLPKAFKELSAPLLTTEVILGEGLS